MGVWDKWEKPENDGPNYVQIDDEGDEFTGVLVDVQEHVTPKGTFPGQKEDTISPKLIFDVDGEEYVLTAFRTVLKNEILEQQPEIGSTVTIKNLGKPRGKNYVNYRVKVASEAAKREGKKDNEDF